MKNSSPITIARKISLLDKDLSKYINYSNNSYLSSLNKNWNNTADEIKNIIYKAI